MKLTHEQFEIIDHTLHRAANQLFCGDSPSMQELVSLGLMKLAGRVSWVPSPYFYVTDAGREAWEENKPPPIVLPKVSARKRRSRERYQRFLDADSGLTFREFIKASG